jgi:molybdopterin adenylyltransferase
VTPPRVAILTISDAGFRGEREDRSGAIIAEWVTQHAATIAGRALVPDESDQISGALLAWADGGEVDVILTTGGTGLAPRDVTPEATRAVLERDAVGIAEALRRAGQPEVATAILSRGVAGVRGRTLIVNLPGSPGGVHDGLAALLPIFPHAVRQLRGETEH